MAFTRNNQYPVVPHNFAVYIKAAKLGFSKITNFEHTIQTESFVEGGVNDYVHSLRVPTATEKVMVFERGVMYTAADIPAVEDDWFQFAKVGAKITSDIIIMVLNANGSMEKTYTVSGAIVKGWSISDLNATSNQVLIERFEILYQKLDIKKATTSSTASTASSIFSSLSLPSLPFLK